MHLKWNCFGFYDNDYVGSLKQKYKILSSNHMLRNIFEMNVFAYE